MATIVVMGLILAAPPSTPFPPTPAAPLPDEAWVRDMLGTDMSGGPCWVPNREPMPRDWLAAYGVRLYPMYQRILTDDRTWPGPARNLIGILIDVGGDRAQFADPVATRLWHPDPEYRAPAVKLLGEIGTERQAAALVPLLGDASPHRVPYTTIRGLAAEAMAKIGGRRELAALDQFVAWTAAAGKLDDPDRDAIVKARDALRKRLDQPVGPKK